MSGIETGFAAGWDQLPPGETVFGSAEWLTATAKALPFDIRILEARQAGKLAGYLPLQVIRRGGMTRAFTPILAYYGGPYIPSADDLRFHERTKLRYEVTTALLARAAREFHHVSLTLDDPDVRAGLDAGWSCRPMYTVVNRLDSDACLDLGGDTLRNVRKAEKAGLTFGPGRDEEGFAKAFARTFSRKGISMAWKPEWAKAMRRELSAAGLLANHAVSGADGREIAFASVALDKPRKRAVLWYSCSLEEADKTGAMHLLMFRLLEAYRGEYEVFDLCGADQRGLAGFKEKYAQELVVRHGIEKWKGPGTRALMGAFTRVRGMLG